MESVAGVPNGPQRDSQTAAIGYLDWLTDPDDPRIQLSLTWTCDVCAARIKHLCTNTITPGHPLPGRIVHIARLTDRRPQPKGEQ